jgi:membrane protease YdiL (CAAX protease family)
MDQLQPNSRRLPLPLLAACCLLPAAQTLLSVYLEIWPFITYPLLKAMILATPVVVWLTFRRPRGVLLADLGVKRTNLLRGLASGVFLGGAILLAYYTFMAPMVNPAPIAAKAKSLGILEHYWLMAGFISFWNSLVEEYYWRAFLFDQLRGYTSRKLWLVLLSGACSAYITCSSLWGWRTCRWCCCSRSGRPSPAGCGPGSGPAATPSSIATSATCWPTWPACGRDGT